MTIPTLLRWYPLHDPQRWRGVETPSSPGQGRRVANEVDATSDTKEVAGLFTVDATAAEGKTIDEVAKVLEASFADLTAHPPTQAELTRALAQVERRHYTQLTSPLTRAILLSSNFVEKGDPSYYRRDYARYYKVTPADLARVAGKYLKPDKVVLTISPAKPDQPKSVVDRVGPLPDSSGAMAPATDAPQDTLRPHVERRSRPRSHHPRPAAGPRL